MTLILACISDGDFVIVRIDLKIIHLIVVELLEIIIVEGVQV